VIDKIGEGFDSEVWKWKKEAEEKMQFGSIEQVS